MGESEKQARVINTPAKIVTRPFGLAHDRDFTLEMSAKTH